MRKLLCFIAGLVVGFLISVIPNFFIDTLHVDICIESCPGWFMGTRIVTYLGTPIVWGVFAIFAFGRSDKKLGTTPIVAALLVSVLVVCLVGWMGYAFHKQIL